MLGAGAGRRHASVGGRAGSAGTCPAGIPAGGVRFFDATPAAIATSVARSGAWPARWQAIDKEQG